MTSVHALLAGDPARCLAILDSGPVGSGPAVHIEVDEDVVVTPTPDASADALVIAKAAAADGKCRVAEIVVEELERS